MLGGRARDYALLRTFLADGQVSQKYMLIAPIIVHICHMQVVLIVPEARRPLSIMGRGLQDVRPLGPGPHEVKV